MITTLRNIDRRRAINWRDPLNKGLVAWWIGLPGWGGGSTYRDLTGQHNATLSGFASGFGWRHSSRPSGSLEIETDGVGSSSQLAADSTAFGSGDFTIGCWFRIDTHGTSGSVLSSRASPGVPGQFSFYVINGTTLTVDIPFVVGNVVSGLTNIPLGKWQRADATKFGNNWTIYLNGKSDGTSSSASLCVYSGPFSIADFPSQPQTAWVGGMDDVSYWTRALSAREVYRRYLQSLSGYSRILNHVGQGPGQIFAKSSSGPTAPRSGSLLPLLGI